MANSQLSSVDGERMYVARAVMVAESQAIMDAYHKLGDGMCRAVETILDHPGKVVVTGLGKSGLVARKLAATLCSTGTPAVYLHPVEALHGDLGVVVPGDVVLVVSRSGATPELLGLHLAMLHTGVCCPVIGILGVVDSPMAHHVDVLLDASVEREADPLNLVPTTSTTVAMAIGDALACAIMHARGFTAADYAKVHPAGNGSGGR